MEWSKASDDSYVSSADAATTAPHLMELTGDYKRLYRWLLLTAATMLVCVAAYIILLFTTSKNVYRRLDKNWVQGARLAVDSSGKTIAFPVYQDTTLTNILVSTDSGKNFEQQRFPWRLQGQISSIQVAPDGKSIVAIGQNYIYLKADGRDSFTCIDARRFPGAEKFEGHGFCFVPGTDSVYIYDVAGPVFCLSYKKYDSIATASFLYFDYRDAIAVNENKQIMAMVNINGQKPLYEKPGVYIGLAFKEVKKYAVAQYNDVVRAPVENSYPTVDSTAKATAPSSSLDDTARAADAGKYMDSAINPTNTIKK